MENIDRFGKCPNCGTNWNGGDVYEKLSNMSCHSTKKPAELKTLAGYYGWTEDNKTDFSNLITHELQGRHLLECPKITCGHIFDRETGQEFISIDRALKNISITRDKRAYNLMNEKLNQEDFNNKTTDMLNSLKEDDAPFN
jgi:hypothetical protein